MSSLLSLVAPLATGAVMAFFRSRLREKLGGRKSNDKLLLDILIWAFCGCCAGIQEARTVDAHNGVHVSCCCRLESRMQQLPLVGQTIAVGPMGHGPMAQGMVPMAQ